VSEQEASTGGGDLQFDHVEQPSGPSIPGRVAVDCAECRESLRTEYFTINDRPVCNRCKATIERLAEPPRGAEPLMRAALFGLGAGIAGAAVYYAVLAIAHLEIGIIAILIGYMVGGGVRRGARGRGGRRFQIVAVALTYFSVASAYVPLAIQEAISRQQTKTVGTTNAAQPVTASVTIAPAQPSRRPSVAGMAVAVVLLVGFALSLPALVVIGGLPTSLISGLIIFFGLRQAWRMTAAPVFVVYGPYRVGGAAGEAGV
jgi:hypothetical protein